ncbi:uncharacterized protein BX664DRAFT_341833 [Halteromyces radiatus]|uniref:uncharacterized protein n=1 Tax=Halteromyces radiatus TaxID=101107 RepID=UPI002220C1D4|nr:uncharacterized protein BX664DRAFT_341833 [Halteromyces radiatus]KAI8079928.1 hypothetical protein BX664DRAFT_341833 [Halteromyces radiatus]
MLSVCRRAATLTPGSLRFLSQRRWNSDSSSNIPPNNNNNNEKDEESTSKDSQFDGLLHVLDGSASKANKTSAVEGITSILNESANKQQQQQQQSIFGSNVGDNNYDMSYLSISLSSMTHAPYQLHVNASFNNTIITLTRPNGSPLVTTSGGSAGFKKAQRSGYEAAHQAAIQLLEKMQAKNLQISNVHIILKGFGPGRDAAFKALVAGAAWNVRRITDATPVAFGGCRPKKARRL